MLIAASIDAQNSHGLALANSISVSKDSVLPYLDTIRDASCIECSMLGFGGRPSKLYFKALTTASSLTLAGRATLFSDSSYTLKYYMFVSVLQESDSLALALLKESIKDTTSICFFCNCTIGHDRFNEILLDQYYGHVSVKYKHGGKVFMGGQAYNFPPANSRLWRHQTKVLNELVSGAPNESRLRLILMSSGY